MVEAKSDKRFQSRTVEIIFDELLDGDEILGTYRDLSQGLYKGFVKWHKGNEGDEDGEGRCHTHVGIILRDKPKFDYKKLTEIFKVGEVRPTLVNPIGKGNTSPVKKLTTYCSYLTDGHDNGRFEDTFNYKFDLELMQCKDDAKILVLLGRGKTMKQIIQEADWNFRAYVMKNKSVIDKMVHNWKHFNEDQTVYHDLDSFKPEVLDKICEAGWNPQTESLILKGPTGLGKTELAKAICKAQTGTNPLFCSNLNKLVHREAGQAFIMDDMNFRGISRTKGIALFDMANDRDIRVLFGIHTIEAQTLRIFTTNEEMEDFLPYDTTGAIDRRICTVDLSEFGQLY